MAKSTRATPNKRNKTLHRFYEPLVLLRVLETVQGERTSRQRDAMSSPKDASRCELRRRFLDCLAYVCDHDKGGDSMTAVFVSTPPLVYHLACNKRLPESNNLVPFLRSILEQLGHFTEPDKDIEPRMLAQCVRFSEKRIETYEQFLGIALERCLESDTTIEIHQKLLTINSTLTALFGSRADLCRACFAMIKSEDLSLVIDAAKQSEDYGNPGSPFANLRHFIGRLGTHVQAVKVLLATAKRFPPLFQDFDIEIENGPASPVLAPAARSKLTLDGIATRMVPSGDRELIEDIQGRLKLLDQHIGLEEIVRKEYKEKSLKPRVHAELILLEYYYRNRESLQFYDNDRYIGASKPACYCCYLYFHEHPVDLVRPATHQNIYLNWLPPTSTEETRDPNSDTAIHELRMFNAMVRYVRQRAIEQLKLQTGGHRRQRQHDSVTWSTFPKTLQLSNQDITGLSKPPVTGLEIRPPRAHTSSRLLTASAPSNTGADLSDTFEGTLRLKESPSEGDDTDDDGGMALTP